MGCSPTNMRVLERVKRDFVHVRSSLLPLVSFRCNHEVLVCMDEWMTFIENHILVQVSLVSGILLVYRDFSNINKIIYLVKEKKALYHPILKQTMIGGISNLHPVVPGNLFLCPQANLPSVIGGCIQWKSIQMVRLIVWGSFGGNRVYPDIQL